jgi:hypothetical protein
MPKYKEELISFAEARPWSLFGTIGIGECLDDDETIRCLRIIEAKLTKTFVHHKYHQLPESERFSTIIAFEGVRDHGNRHSHFLMYVPVPRKGKLSRETLITKLPLWLKILWSDLSCKPWTEPSWLLNGLPSFRFNGYEWCEKQTKPTIDIQIGGCRESGPSYSLKHATDKEVAYASWGFITPPKFEKFENENLNGIRNRNRQVRRSLCLS